MTRLRLCFCAVMVLWVGAPVLADDGVDIAATKTCYLTPRADWPNTDQTQELTNGPADPSTFPKGDGWVGWGGVPDTPPTESQPYVEIMVNLGSDCAIQGAMLHTGQRYGGSYWYDWPVAIGVLVSDGPSPIDEHWDWYKVGELVSLTEPSAHQRKPECQTQISPDGATHASNPANEELGQTEARA